VVAVVVRGGRGEVKECVGGSLLMMDVSCLLLLVLGLSALKD
jgi:hypothetical protein